MPPEWAQNGCIAAIAHAEDPEVEEGIDWGPDLEPEVMGKVPTGIDGYDIHALTVEQWRRAADLVKPSVVKTHQASGVMSY